MVSPAVWQFYEQLKDKFSWLSSGKLRANYATVGNDAPWGSIQDVYNQGNPFVAGTTSSILFSLPTTKNNDALKPKGRTVRKSVWEMSFLRTVSASTRASITPIPSTSPEYLHIDCHGLWRQIRQCR